MPDSPTAPLQHIAIIMDGNGRWAKQRNLPRIEGHRQGVQNVELVMELASEINLQYLTLYAFSSENWNRPADEVNALMSLLKRFLKEKEKLLHKHEVKLRAIGRTSELPKDVQKLLLKVENNTKDYPRTLGLALNYGSRIEVVDAVKAYARKVIAGEEHPETLEWNQFSKFLYTCGMPDPDLVIRTSGETRLSNFLLLQAAYAEIHYSPLNWPDFGREAFYGALEDYKKRERRFGLTGDQITQDRQMP